MTVFDLYCRLSVAPDGSTETVERQEADMRAALAKTGDTVRRVYVDNNLSAWKRNVRRPDFEALLAEIAAGRTTHVMVWHIDRYVRRPYDFERLVQAAERGLIIRSLLGELDLTNSDQLAMARVLCTMAAKSSDDTSRRVKAALASRVAAGHLHGGRGGRSFGYAKDGGIIEAEAAVLREVARRRLDGENWSSIVVDLRQREIYTRAGIPFTRTSLREILARPINAGIMERDGQQVGQLAEAIFDPETWADLCAMSASARRGRAPVTRYLLTGYVICGSCGRIKYGAVLTGRGTEMSDGRPRRVYRCTSDLGKGRSDRCAKSITAEYVEQIVGEYVKAALSDPDYRARLRLATEADSDESAGLLAEIERAGTALADLVGNYGAGLLPESAYNSARMRLTTRLTSLRARLAEATDPNRLAAQIAAQAAARWDGDGVTDDDRRRLVEGIVSRVTINPPSGHGFSGFDSSRVHVELLLPAQPASAVREQTG